MRILMRGILMPILLVLILASILEIGLRLRQWVAPTMTTPSARAGEVSRVLFINDSIGGFLADGFSVANKTAQVLRSHGPGVEFLEISRPALKTSEVVELLQARIDEIRPQIVVMMIGKSDYEVGFAPLPLWFLELRISRFVELLISDVRLRFLQMTMPAEPTKDLDVAFVPIWKLYGEKKYDAAIPMLEAAIRDYPNYEAGLRALYYSYIFSGKQRQGREFFTKVAPKSDKSELLQTFAMGLQILDAADSQEKKIRLAELQALAAKDPVPRNSFKTSLWIRKSQGDAAGFYEMLRNLEPFQSSRVLPKTSQNLRTILSELTDRGIRTILLQYPTDHIAALSNSIGPSSSLVEIYETRTWLLEKKTTVEVVDLVDSDVEHLTPEGAEVIAQRLAEVIQSR